MLLNITSQTGPGQTYILKCHVGVIIALVTRMFASRVRPIYDT